MFEEQGLPSEYKDFNTLTDRAKEYYDETKELGYRNVGINYQRLLVMLAQSMDRYIQYPLVKGLKEDISKRGSGSTLPSEEHADILVQNDLSREKYQDSLTNNSCYFSLLAVQQSDDARKKYLYGLNGGRRAAEHYYKTLPVFHKSFDSLRQLDPRLACLELFQGSFTGNPSYRQHFIDLQKAFSAYGFDYTSPEFRLAMLSKMEFHVRRNMLAPLINQISNFTEPVPKRIVQGPNIQPFVSQEKIFHDILLGDEYVSSADPNSEAIYNGSEFYRGLYDLIQLNKYKLLSAHFSDQIPDVNFAINGIVFLATSKRGSLVIQDIWGSLIEPLTRKDFQGVKDAMINLIKRRPDLYHKFIWEALGLTENGISADKEPRKETRKESNERKKDPSLRPEVEKYVGVIGRFSKVVTHYNYTLHRVEAREEQGDVEIAIVGKGAEQGRVTVKYLDDRTDPKTGKRLAKSVNHQPFGSFLEKVKAGIYMFPETE